MATSSSVASSLQSATQIVDSAFPEAWSSIVRSPALSFSFNVCGSNALLVNGTSDNDVILFQRLSRNRIRVRVNGENLGTFSGVNVVIANGLEGNDQIIVDGSLIVDARLFGNDGNDQLYAGLAGINLLDGGSGNDRLYASPFGSTVIVGGVGNDRLYGGFLSSDILIGGTGEDQLYGGLLSQSILIGRAVVWNNSSLGRVFSTVLCHVKKPPAVSCCQRLLKVLRDESPAYRPTDSRHKVYAEKLLPHPQDFTAFGFLKVKPRLSRPV